MPYSAATPLVQNMINSSGGNLANGSIEFYLTGTSTPTNIYSDSAGTSAGTSVTLDSRGAPENGGSPIQLFFDTDVTYKLILKDSAGTAVGPTIDPFAVSFDAADTTFTQGGTGAVERTMETKLREVEINIKDFGAVGDNVTDDTTAIQNAYNRAADTTNPEDGATVVWPAGNWLVSNITIKPWVKTRGQGRWVTNIYQKASSTGAVLQVQPDSVGTPTDQSRVHSTELTGFYLNGNAALQGAATANHGIHFTDNTNDPNYDASYFYRSGVVHDVEIAGCAGDGLRVGAGREQLVTGNMRVTNCDGHGIHNLANDPLIGPGTAVGSCNGSSLLLSGHSNAIIQGINAWNSADRANDGGYAVDMFNIRAFCMTGNVINDTVRITETSGGRGEGVIVGNQFQPSTNVFSATDTVKGTVDTWFEIGSVIDVIIGDNLFNLASDGSRYAYMVETTSATAEVFLRFHQQGNATALYRTSLTTGSGQVTTEIYNLSNSVETSDFLTKKTLADTHVMELERTGTDGDALIFYKGAVKCGSVAVSADRAWFAGRQNGNGVQVGDGTWNSDPLKLGSYYLWVDATGDLRINSGAPASDTDGTVVGTQS